MEYALITPAEADAILVLQTAWIALADADKTNYIAKASVYAQTNWTCVDVDWTDTASIPEEIKRAVAYYALASFGGNLYGDPTESVTHHGNLRSISSKLGPLEEETSYFMSGSQVPSGLSDALSYPNSLMHTLCTRHDLYSTALTRV